MGRPHARLLDLDTPRLVAQDLAALHAAGQVNSALLVKGVLLAVGANSLTRMVVAGVSGGLAYARRIAGVLVASWLLAAGLAFLWH